MKKLIIPYGQTQIEFSLQNRHFDILKSKLPDNFNNNQKVIVNYALDNPVNEKVPNISPETTIGIGINDITRPIPHNILLLALLTFLEDKGASAKNIVFYIATGTHLPADENQIRQIVGNEIAEKYKILSHNCDNAHNLIKIGKTTRNTPVFVNKAYYFSDVKIVVGNIEPHHFMGFSGGYKTASIGLTSRETITANHALLSHSLAKMGLYTSNPMRKEVEEIGKMISVDFALNAIISPDKNVIACYWGSPEDVIVEGINYIRENIQLDVGDFLNQYDLVIASPGGYPKDINFYQSQKALTHASLFAKPSAKIILVAECIESFGSEKFYQFISSRPTVDDIIHDFESQDFEIGPHKAYQLAKQIKTYNIDLVSSLSKDEVLKLKLNYQDNLQNAINDVLISLPKDAGILVLPYATQTMPKIVD